MKTQKATPATKGLGTAARKEKSWHCSHELHGRSATTSTGCSHEIAKERRASALLPDASTCGSPALPQFVLYIVHAYILVFVQYTFFVKVDTVKTSLSQYFGLATALA